MSRASGAPWLYAIGLGSNRRHHRHGSPPEVLRAAAGAMVSRGLEVERLSQIIASAPLGPAERRFANAAALIRSPLAPPDLLALLKHIEHDFGRRAGRRWGDRVLDLDILWWSGGTWRSRALAIPHRELARRSFALAPLNQIAPRASLGPALQVTHFHHRLATRRPRRG